MEVRRGWIVWLLVAALAGCQTAAIYRVREASLPVRSDVTVGQVARVIQLAGERRGWVIRAVEPGTMRGSYSRGRHRADVEIRYSASSFGIDYLDSSGLKKEGDRIHGVYNSWVVELEEAIRRESQLRLE